MSGSYPAPMAANAGAAARRLFYALAIDLPATSTLGATRVRLLDGSGVLNFLGSTWVGQDGDYGAWLGADAIEETLGTQASSFPITLAPLSDAAQQQIANPLAQMAPITLYGGEVDLATGAPVCDPEVLFYGALDIGHIRVGTNSRTISVDVVAATELMFLTDDGSTLTSSWHNQFFPNELGFAFVDAITHDVPWGGKGPRPDQASHARNFDTDRGGGRTTLRF